MTHRGIVSAAALTLGVALLGAAPTGPGAAFLDAWAKVPSYTVDIKAHEVKGTDTQDRTYHYAYLKPHFAKIDITGGPGRGGGAVWKGGDTVTGHRGGAISFIKLSKPLHDAEATSLRGGTIAQASFEDSADALKAAASSTNGEETVGGTTFDTVAFPYKDEHGATKRVLVLSRVTHLPVRRMTYAGDAVVESEEFTNLNIAANLKESDF